MTTNLSPAAAVGFVKGWMRGQAEVCFWFFGFFGFFVVISVC
jgi:hypothetical protein